MNEIDLKQIDKTMKWKYRKIRIQQGIKNMLEKFEPTELLITACVFAFIIFAAFFFHMAYHNAQINGQKSRAVNIATVQANKETKLAQIAACKTSTNPEACLLMVGR